jgi:hypothetical protein
MLSEAVGGITFLKDKELNRNYRETHRLTRRSLGGLKVGSENAVETIAIFFKQ